MPAAATNGFDREKLQDIVGRIEQCFADLLSERGAYMNRCRGIREGITAAYDDAKAQGIPKKELRALVKTRELERKIAAQFAELEADEQQNYQMIQEALGDFADSPLGAAAVERAKKKGEALDSLTQ
jgi:Arc/MetJ-type ribon-helix-helix transcriptional regulator